MMQLLQELHFSEGSHIQTILHFPDFDLLDRDCCQLW